MTTTTQLDASAMPATAETISWSQLLQPVRTHWLKLGAASVLVGCIGLGISFIVPPTFTARTQVLPPVQQQPGMAAMAALGSLSALIGGGGGRNSADQYVGLLQSATVLDRMVDRFKLVELYDSKFKVDARKEFISNMRVSVGKKDGMIAIEVDDKSPQRAAEMANALVEEMQKLSSTLDISEAQQRRGFFERQLRQARADLAQSQDALAASGFSASTLKSEPKAAAENYARLKTALLAAEAKLRGLESALMPSTQEVQQQRAIATALREQLQQFVQTEAPKGQSYVSAYRDYRYHEALVEMYTKQFELAKLDEAREGSLLQVVDPALPPERKSRPKRSVVGLLSTLAAFVAFSCALVLRDRRQQRSAT